MCPVPSLAKHRYVNSWRTLIVVVELIMSFLSSTWKCLHDDATLGLRGVLGAGRVTNRQKYFAHAFINHTYNLNVQSREGVLIVKSLHTVLLKRYVN